MNRVFCSKGHDNVVACKSSGYVHHYYNPHMGPDFLDSSEKSIGLTDMKTTTKDHWFICQFKRQKENRIVPNYFDLNQEHFVLAAYGDYSPQTEKLGGIKAHEFKINSSKAYNFVEKTTLIKKTAKIEKDDTVTNVCAIYNLKNKKANEIIFI
jgi:hypothetical protein